MKKIAFILFLIGMAYFSIAQFYPTTPKKGIDSQSPAQVFNNPNRSVPDGILLYSQPFNCPSYGFLISETIDDSQVAVDFLLPASSSVDILRWWFAMNDAPASTNWIVKIYDNQTCLPANLLGTWNISSLNVNYELVCNVWGWNVYDCWAELSPSFSPEPNVNYWISIQADVYDYYWCTYGNVYDYMNCIAVFRGPYYDVFNFTPVDILFYGGPADFAFELYSSPLLPVETPISNWALGIGVFLILAVTVLRFRRII